VEFDIVRPACARLTRAAITVSSNRASFAGDLGAYLTQDGASCLLICIGSAGGRKLTKIAHQIRANSKPRSVLNREDHSSINRS
jgi:hypothetical protein